MIPSDFDLRYVAEQHAAMRREAAAYRLAQTNRPGTATTGPSPLTHLRAFLSRLHLIRPVTSRAKATA